MISFSFNKKNKDTKATIQEEHEKVEYISSFSNDTITRTPEKSFPHKLNLIKPKRGFRLKERRIKEFIFNDISESQTNSIQDKTTLRINSRVENKAVEEKVNILISNESFRKMQNKTKFIKSSSNKKSDPVLINDFVTIITGKHYGYHGKVVYLSESSDIIRVYVEAMEKEIYVRLSGVQVISIDEISERNSLPIKPIDLSKIEMKEQLVDNWLFVGLFVRIIDKSYKNGRFTNEIVVIDDVIGLDECSCQTGNGKILYDVRRNMLDRVQPIRKQHAKVLGGPHLSRVVLVLAIEELTATVIDTNSEEKLFIDIRLLCRTSF